VNNSCVKYYRFCPRLFYTLSCTLSERLNFQRILQAVIYQHVGVADLSVAGAKVCHNILLPIQKP